jgi:hypothetical protein
LATEERFLLGHRSHGTLRLSPVVDFWAEVDSPEAHEEARVHALNVLSFFIAHALLHACPEEDEPLTSAIASAQINESSVQEQSTTFAAGKGSSLTNTTQTNQPGTQGSWGGAGTQRLTTQVIILPSMPTFHLPLQRWQLLNMMHPLGLRAYLSIWRLLVAPILKYPFTAVFTTSGWPSKHLPLTTAYPIEKKNVYWRLLTIHTTLKDSVYRGDLDGNKVVIKLAENDLVHQLRHEVEMYKLLKDLQGHVVPFCYGMFHMGNSCALMILEDCGTPPESFSDLSYNQR